MISSNSNFSNRIRGAFLVGTMLGGIATPLYAQDVPAPAAAAPALAPAPAVAAPALAPAGPTSGTIRSIQIKGAERLEPETVRAYSNLVPGQVYTAEKLDAALKDLYATELFTDVVISGADSGNLVITVKENPVINRIVLEGNKRIKSDKITPEIRLAPRQIFTRSKVRSDVERIIELYKRQGRFAATVDPKIVELDQNRVDLVFEIHEGDKSKIRAINVIGNNTFSDDRLQKEMYTKQSGGLFGFFKSNDSYDPDRLAADQQKLRAFYLTQGYADFRVVSALAELTPDRKDFVITYVVEEGPRYKFGTVDAESALRDLGEKEIKTLIPIKAGQWFNAKQVEDVVASLTEVAGNRGYAFADINPNYTRNTDKHIMDISFRVGESPRVYVERIDITGNTQTRDKVIRREFRVQEGDAFSAIRVKRSQDRLQSLGFFQDKLEIKQTEGSAPDRVVLSANVEEKSTGQLQLSAGYSSLEKFVFNASVTQNNFLGKGQIAEIGVNYSKYSRSASLSFTEPYLFDKNVSLGGEIFRRDYNSYNNNGNGQRNTTYSQTSTGAAIRTGFALTEFLTMGGRYSLSQDKITLDKNTFYTDLHRTPPVGLECDPAKAGSYLCDEVGTRLTSLVGFTVAFDDTDGIRPTRGQRLIFSNDFAGLGGDTKYARTRLDATKFKALPHNFIASIHAEGGYIHPLGQDPVSGSDPIRISDRFYGTQLRGFDIRGIGPRVRRLGYDDTGNIIETKRQSISDPLGGHAYYSARIELEFPTSSGLRSLGIRPSAYIDAGSVFKLKAPKLANYLADCFPVAENLDKTVKRINVGDPISCGPTTGVNGYTRVNGFREFYLGDSISPRLSVGIGVNWTSPFGPLRIDIAKAILKQPGDVPKLFSFNVGTQF